MSYTKTQWNNDTAPAINETNLNKIEQGIYDNDSAITTINTNIGDLSDLETTANTDLVSAINEVDAQADDNTAKLNGTKVAGDMIVDSVKTKNLFNKNKGEDGYLSASGNVVSNSDHRVSDYIDIDGISNITISGSQGSGLENCFYNSSKAVIGHFALSSASTTQEVPSGTKYIRLTVKKTALDTYQLEQGTTATSYTGYFDSNSAVSDSILWNGYTNDMATNNDTDTWLPVLRGNITQHTTLNSLGSRINAITTTAVTPNSTYFNTADIDHNVVHKTGHVVEVLFRGKLKADLPNNAILFTMPYAPVWQITAMFGYGERYGFDQSNGVRWCYADSQGQIKTGMLSAGKYIHVNIVYITNS